VRSRLRSWSAELRRTFPTGDFALWAAGATFFGIVGVVPAALVVLRVAAALAGSAQVIAMADTAITGLPPGHGTSEALRTLFATGAGLSWTQTAVAVFPATLYGEGLRRAFRQLTPTRPERLTGWRGRAGVLPVVAVAPLLVLGVLATAPMVAPLYASGRLLKAVSAAFHITFVVVSVVLILVFRLLGPGRIRFRALLLGAFGSGAVIAGFLQGFLLFLAIPLDWSLPFGGLPVVGAVVALALWLYLIHVLVLVGYRATVVLDAITRR
jgi:membrane protein